MFDLYGFFILGKLGISLFLMYEQFDNDKYKMDGNKDEVLRCCRFVENYFKDGNKERVFKFFYKVQKFYLLKEVEGR